MEPAPIDVNKLRGILGKSLAVMNKVESTKPIALSETTRNQVEVEDNEYEEPAPRTYNEEMVRNSNLAPAIKQLMIERPIGQATMQPTFRREDLYDEKDEKPFPETLPKKKAAVPQRRINETVINSNSDTITISKNQLDSLINERLSELLAKSYSKTLVEETISKTIKTLIAEGKIVTKKKTI